MMELKPCPCVSGSDIHTSEIGEEIVFCDLTARWMNITLGDCLGNCYAEKRRADNEL